MLRFDEAADSVLPSDATGTLADPTVPAGVVLPAVVSGTIGGFGRDFARTAPSGLLYEDPSDLLMLTRALTIAAVVRLDIAALATGNICTVVQMGRGGVGGPVTFGLRFDVTNAATRRVTARLFWETAAASAVADVGIDFAYPAGEYVAIIASREVVGTTFTCRYQVNGDQVTGGTTATLDVGSTTGAEMSVGMGMSGASYINHLDGVIDALEVMDAAMSHEEMAWTWSRIAVDMPAGAAAVRRMVPPGVYSNDPSSRIQRELAGEGRALGHAKAVARRRREYGLPDRAWGDVLERWESILGRPARAGDSIADRRASLLEVTQNLRGLNPAEIKLQLEESFDLAGASIQILEYDNDLTETFTSGTPSNRARVDNGTGAWLSDGAAVAAGRQEFAATADDLRYGGRSTSNAGMYLYSIGEMADGWIHGRIERVTGENNIVMGFAIGSWVPDEWIFIGLGFTTAGSVQKVCYATFADGVLSSITDIETPYATNPVSFRIKCSPNAQGKYVVKYGANDAAAKSAVGTTLTTGPKTPMWAGFGALSTAASTTATYRFDDIFLHVPRGRQRFNWYAYRDPGLPGGPNMPAARSLVQRIKHAHTSGAAIEQQVTLCDDATRLVDREPIGA